MTLACCRLGERSFCQPVVRTYMSCNVWSSGEHWQFWHCWMSAVGCCFDEVSSRGVSFDPNKAPAFPSNTQSNVWLGRKACPARRGAGLNEFRGAPKEQFSHQLFCCLRLWAHLPWFSFSLRLWTRRITISERSGVDTSLNSFDIICNQVLFTVSLTVLEVAATRCWMRCWALLSSIGWQWPRTTADATTAVYNSFHFQSLTEGWL